MIDIEVCANSFESALAAQEGGAVRVELCANLADGGTTPAKSQIEMTRELVDIDLNVIVRPRGGDFLYTDFEFETMKRDVDLCGSIGCDGVVIGILNKYGYVDLVRNSILIDIAKKWNMNVTFHRAFDRTPNLMDAILDIINIGCDRVLTSGGYNSAYEGRYVIKELVELYNSEIKIMGGAGINMENVRSLVEFTGISEIHGTFQKNITSQMEYFNPNFDPLLDSNFKLTDQKLIHEIYLLLNQNI